MTFESLKILVTGGAGFIGSHIVDRLLNMGSEVMVLDNLSSGRMEHISHHMDRRDFEFVKGDIRNRELLHSVMQDIDVVFHEAAQASVPASVENPILTNEVNVTGTVNLLQACLDTGTKRFIFASSAAIYGEAKTIPITETILPQPTSPYAVSKLASEQYIEVFHKLYGLQTVSLRYFNPYGPRQVAGGVIYIFLKKILNKQPPTIYGDGEQTRDFVNIEDVVDANILALTRGVDGAFNIGSGNPVSINQLAKMIQQLTGKETQFIYSNPRPGDPKKGDADISKARRILNFNPKISLQDGLIELIAWYSKRNRG